jgi:hypothetical protein
MEIDHKRFNSLSPALQAQAIVEAGCKARGLPSLQPGRPGIDDSADESTKLAAMIVRAGRKARGQE